ncbi:MAG: helix-turn-helix domain-containing protein, partial [Synergistaceae bacterium]|nr:helix-turn-helix domain-containing protein [Synergistaceae bacterium]
MNRIRREVISDALRKMGINQTEFAKRLGLSEKHVSEILNGKSGQIMKNFERIANLLDLPL